ncbi:MAG: hypothetical protein QXK06_04525 [Candidatus Diapherotrites archaeon]
MKSKGMEMPIQIFIILFVLLAVAMLVLQMVSQQFAERQKKLKEEEMKRAYNEKLASMNETCSNLCAQANSDGSLSSKVAFCAKKFEDGLDITKNSMTGDYTEEFSNIFGVGICEDMIYCPHTHSCKIGGGTALTMDTCKTIMCQYFANQGFTQDERTEKLRQFIRPGNCYFEKASNVPNHWYTRLFDKDGSKTVDLNSEVVCP